MIFLSIYQTSAYPFSCTLIGYSSLEYPVISTDLHNKMVVHTRNHFFTDEITFVVTGYSLVWYILKHCLPVSQYAVDCQ